MAQKPVKKKQNILPGWNLKEIRRSRTKNTASSSARRVGLPALHHMRCPKCGLELIEIDYKGIKVDKCSECEGVWLDSGELETVSKLGQSALECFFGRISDPLQLEVDPERLCLIPSYRLLAGQRELSQKGEGRRLRGGAVKIAEPGRDMFEKSLESFP